MDRFCIHLKPMLSVVASLLLGWLLLREGIAYRELRAIADVPLATSTETGADADLLYFYSPACAPCRSTTPAVLRAERRNPRLRVVYCNVAAADFYELRERLNRRFAIPDAQAALIPALFTQRRALVGKEKILASLATEVKASLTVGGPASGLPAEEGARKRAKDRLSPVPVAAAALADSINPCALSTALFLISYLAWAGSTRRQFVLTGLLFCSGVFCCYALAGMGLLRGLYHFSGFATGSLVMNGAAGAGALLFGGLNLRQYHLLRRRQVRPAELGLPTAARRTAHGAIRTLLNRPALFGLAAFTTGAIVAAVELPCTGQIYLPTIVYLSGFPEERATALGFLLLYNLVFVTPLLALFALAVTVKSRSRIQDLIRRNLPASRLVNATCFFTIALFLFLNVVR